jgi:hypothetical protein
MRSRQPPQEASNHQEHAGYLHTWSSGLSGHAVAPSVPTEPGDSSKSENLDILVYFDGFLHRLLH